MEKHQSKSLNQQLKETLQWMHVLGYMINILILIRRIFYMLWDILDKKNYLLYINRDIDLKVKIYEKNEEDEIYMNYKGFNLTVPMFVWEFGEDLCLASIEGVSIEGAAQFDKHFIVSKKDRDRFLDEMYFFLMDNDMNSVLHERYRANWE